MSIKVIIFSEVQNVLGKPIIWDLENCTCREVCLLEGPPSEDFTVVA